MLDVSVADTCTHIFDKITHAVSLNKLSQAYLSKVAIQLTDICNSPLSTAESRYMQLANVNIRCALPEPYQIEPYTPPMHHGCLFGLIGIDVTH